MGIKVRGVLPDVLRKEVPVEVLLRRKGRALAWEEAVARRELELTGDQKEDK